MLAVVDLGARTLGPERSSRVTGLCVTRISCARRETIGPCMCAQREGECSSARACTVAMFPAGMGGTWPKT
eukprot:3987969-Prymnesium_polylepis.2